MCVYVRRLMVYRTIGFHSWDPWRQKNFLYELSFFLIRNLYVLTGGHCSQMNQKLKYSRRHSTLLVNRFLCFFGTNDTERLYDYGMRSPRTVFIFGSLTNVGNGNKYLWDLINLIIMKVLCIFLLLNTRLLMATISFRCDVRQNDGRDENLTKQKKNELKIILFE